MRDTIPFQVDAATAGRVVRKSVEYDTGMTLSPGTYKLRFVARENGEGKTGTYESSFTIPDLTAAKGLRTSSVVLSNQRDAVASKPVGVKNEKKLLILNPLIDNGQKLTPNVTRVFHPGQTLLAYVEVYDPSIPEFLPENFRRADVEGTLALYRDNKKIFETIPIRANRLNDKREGTIPVWLQFPVSKVEPGKYECQVNLIDEFGRKFAFPRTSLAILPTGTASEVIP